MNVISLIYPHLSHPSESRFQNFFSVMVGPSIPQKKKAKHFKTFQINIPNILSKKDTRTTVMLKNISRNITKEHINMILSSKCKYDYIYVPKKKKFKNSGFVFLNMTSAMEILKLLHFLRGEEMIKGPKGVEVCYSNIQGKDEMIKIYGEV